MRVWLTRQKGLAMATPLPVDHRCCPLWPFPPLSSSPPAISGLILTPVCTGVLSPANIREAHSRPDYAAPFGWREPMQKKISRIAGFRAMEWSPFRTCGGPVDSTASPNLLLDPVIALTCKVDPERPSRW